jgi:hypothetical protein
MTDRIPTIDQPVVSASDEGTEVAAVVELTPKRTRRTKEQMGADAIFKLIGEELQAQHQKWGVQDHPLQGGVFPGGSQAYYQKQADGWKAINDQRVKDDVIGWDGILIEETFEALAEGDVDAAIEELVQVAAVAVQAILSLKRNAGGVA